MKKLVLMAIVATTLSAAAQAQTHQKKDRLATIGLTPQQKTSIDSVRKIYEEKSSVIKKDAALSREAKQEKLKEVKKEQVAQINTLLTLEQIRKIKKQNKKASKKKEVGQ